MCIPSHNGARSDDTAQNDHLLPLHYNEHVENMVSGEVVNKNTCEDEGLTEEAFLSFFLREIATVSRSIQAGQHLKYVTGTAQ